MSAAVGEEKVEPNLTALLDLILQLVMFFMVCVNFVSEQINQNVQLPASSSAVEIQAKTETQVLVVNIEITRRDRRDSNGKVIRDLQGHPIRDFEVFEDGRKVTRIVFANEKDISYPQRIDDLRGKRVREEGEAMLEAQRYLADKAKSYKARESRETGKPVSQIKEVKVPVVIRADLETTFGLVYPLITQCKKEGFVKIELRALSKAKK